MRETNDKARQAYEQLISSPAERAIYEEWMREWSAYTKVGERVLAMSRAHTSGGLPQEAIHLNEVEGIPLGRKSDALLVKAAELNNAGANAAGELAAQQYSSAMIVIISILVAAIAGGIAIGFYVVKDVSSGIASIVRPMQALGAGDLSAVVPYQGMKTEMGTMGDGRCGRRPLRVAPHVRW